MFCSSCGKEIDEGSAFCSGCGKAVGAPQATAAPAPVQQVVYVDRVQRKGIAGAPDEVKKKTMVLLLYFLGAAMLLSMILIFHVTKFGICTELIEISSISQRTYEYFYEEYSAIIWFLSLILFLPSVTKGIVLWKACVNRNLDVKQKNVAVSCVLGSICWIIILPIISNALSSRLQEDVGFTALTYLLIVCVIAHKIIYAVLYHNAAVSEVDNLYREKYHKSIERWTCKVCGNENTNKDLFCQKCGKNYGYSEESNGKNSWICRSCNTVNDRKDLYCKFCGKYK